MENTRAEVVVPRELAHDIIVLLLSLEDYWYYSGDEERRDRIHAMACKLISAEKLGSRPSELEELEIIGDLIPVPVRSKRSPRHVIEEPKNVAMMTLPNGGGASPNPTNSIAPPIRGRSEDHPRILNLEENAAVALPRHMAHDIKMFLWDMEEYWHQQGDESLFQRVRLLKSILMDAENGIARVYARRVADLLDEDLVLLCHKPTFCCRIVLWGHAFLRQAHKRIASRHTWTAWRRPRGTKTGKSL